ncbi:nitronate monooxygenase [Peptoniphilus mikwangii]|uniref:nitronate monooxygenase n=1 Tax=Peptoniphilus mikwangii TaxID=1354300 RepID=UPI00040346F0|nr:nitronate monooxygenase [Peptoniphilus mikwangii]
MKLQEMLNIKYPLIQGGMAHIATGKFAAAVSNSGGLGVIGSGGFTAKELRDEIETCLKLTDKPFGINILLLHREIEEISDIVCEYGIKILTTGAGNPGKYIDKWKAHNIKIFPVISSKALAIRMEKLGVDGVIAEGQEAGGHIGELGTIVLVNEVANSLSIPVIAAGGIASGKQLLAVEVLGAVGAQIGTCLLPAIECPIHDDYKEKIINAKSSQVTVIGRINGLPVRLLKNEMTRKYIECEKNGAELQELEQMTLGALRRAVKDGDMINGSIMCGQVVGEVNLRRKLVDILDGIYSEYLNAKEKLCAK